MSGFAIFGMIVAAVVVLVALLLIVLTLPDFGRYLKILKM